MPKTLADYNPEERAQMVGMWCDTKYGTGCPRIYCGAGFNKFLRVGSAAQMMTPSRENFGFVQFDEVYPRFDLPRAWSPDGTPVKGEWKTRSAGLQPGPGRGLTHHETPTRRFITEWEVAP